MNLTSIAGWDHATAYATSTSLEARITLEQQQRWMSSGKQQVHSLSRRLEESLLAGTWTLKAQYIIDII